MSTHLATAQTFESLRREDEHGEWWAARDLQFPLGYDQWRRFEDSIERAIASAQNGGTNSADHFATVGKLVQNGLPVDRYVVDYRLSRFGAYLVAMNGDPRKPEIAAAQTYFAVQTRVAETRPDVSAIDRRTLAQWLIEAEDAREVAEARVAELEPVAETALRLIDAAGDYSVREAAQILCRDRSINIGQGRLFGYLRQIGWIQSASLAYQRHVDAGRVCVRTSIDHDRFGIEYVQRQIRITPKGLTELHRLLGVAS